MFSVEFCAFSQSPQLNAVEGGWEFKACVHFPWESSSLISASLEDRLWVRESEFKFWHCHFLPRWCWTVYLACACQWPHLQIGQSNVICITRLWQGLNNIEYFYCCCYETINRILLVCEMYKTLKDYCFPSIWPHKTNSNKEHRSIIPWSWIQPIERTGRVHSQHVSCGKN